MFQSPCAGHTGFVVEILEPLKDRRWAGDVLGEHLGSETSSTCNSKLNCRSAIFHDVYTERVLACNSTDANELSLTLLFTTRTSDFRTEAYCDSDWEVCLVSAGATRTKAEAINTHRSVFNGHLTIMKNRTRKSPTHSSLCRSLETQKVHVPVKVLPSTPSLVFKQSPRTESMWTFRHNQHATTNGRYHKVFVDKG